MKLLIKNGTVVDPARSLVKRLDLLTEDDRIIRMARNISDSEAEVIDAAGCFVMPGFIDLHVHLREPGFEHKETIYTGSRAAARGGYTTICAMPNTKPVIDDAQRVEFVNNVAKTSAIVNVLQIGAVTKGQQGEELADIEDMVKQGIPAISEDGKSVMDAGLYIKAMRLAAKCHIPVFAHCEDKNLVGKGVLNAGSKAAEFGVEGITNSVEDIIVARDIMLAREADVHLHLCHCSTQASVSLVGMARMSGVKISAEVCPHHFTLTEDDIIEEDANYKMNPPLRTKKDVEALKKGLKDGTMDVIATDHAPHHFDEKNQSMQKAPFGIVGLETAAALTYSELVEKKVLTILQMAEKMSYNPAMILGIDKGSLQEGKPADIVIFDTAQEYEIHVADFVSKGKNSPFDGRRVKGKTRMTICGGQVVFQV